MTGMLVFHSDFAGIYYVMTIPQERCQGFATDMMSYLINQAINQGSHTAILAASEAGKGLYQRLGFIPVSYFTEFA